MSTAIIERPKPDRATLSFVPELVYFEPSALNYPKGQRIFDWVKKEGIPYLMTTSHNRITNLPGDTELEQYKTAKRSTGIHR